MAFGCARFGLILGIIFLMIAAAITWLSLYVLSLLALDYKASSSAASPPTFYSLSAALLPRYKWLLDLSSIVYCSGAVIAYLQTFGALLATGLWSMARWDKATFSLSSASLAVQAVILLGLAPLCMAKDIMATKWASIVGLACIGYIVVMTLFYVPCTAAKSDLGSLLKPSDALALFSSFPTFIFAFACQFNVFTVANELKAVTLSKLNSIFIASVSTGVLVYSICMILPFLTFGASIESTYLTNLPNPDGSVDAPVIVGYMCASLSLSISYVLLLQPIRVSLMALLFGSNQPDGSKELRWRVSLVLLIMLASYGLAALLGSNLSLPINLAGLLGGNTTGFILPFTMYFKRYGLKANSALSFAVLLALAFCYLLYPICLAGIIYGEVQK